MGKMVWLWFTYLGVLGVSGGLYGRIMSFIDVNADCFTDLVVSDTSNSITVYLANDKEPAFNEDHRFRHQFPNDSRVLNVAVGDFDGDSFPDLAVSLAFDRSDTSERCMGAHRVHICYGSVDGFRCYPASYDHDNRTDAVFCQQPLVLDCDLDQRSDLLTVIQSKDGPAFACLQRANETGFFRQLLAPFGKASREIPMRSPAYNAFVDVNGDLNPEIVLWTKTDSKQHLAGVRVLHLVEDGRWTDMDGWIGPAPRPDTPQLMPKTSTAGQFHLGQPVYDDINKDGLLDLLLPFCRLENDGHCNGLYVNVWTQESGWNDPVLQVNLTDQTGVQWAVFKETIDNWMDQWTFRVQSGDYTRDGYPDLLVVLQQAGSGQRAFLLENVPCAMGQVCGQLQRTFRVWWNGLSTDRVRAAAFFDLGEDGALDVLLERGNGSAPEQSHLDFAVSSFEGDTTFLKVQVFTSTCLDACRLNREGSAVSLPGASLLYTSSDTDGNPIRGCYTQRSMSANRPLMLPYALFGLGRTPNFVEKLRVGAPSWPPRNTSWEQLVPNARIYVIPHPVEQPRLWVHRLYLTPNRLIISSLAALSILCGLIIIVVCGLHMQERRVDRKERELQREKFHFDAM